MCFSLPASNIFIVKSQQRRRRPMGPIEICIRRRSLPHSSLIMRRILNFNYLLIRKSWTQTQLKFNSCFLLLLLLLLG